MKDMAVSAAVPRGQWIRDILRLFLAFGLLPYGLSKLTNTQFPGALAFFDDAIKRLEGHSVQQLPGLAVFLLFFGFSRPYQIVAGLLEIAAGSLLLWRKSWPIGALLYLAILANVVLVDLCYHVWLNGTVMASLLLVGNLLLLFLERERFVRSVRLLLGEAGEESLASPKTGTEVQPRSRFYPFQVAAIAFALLVVVMTFVDALTAGH